MQNLKNRILLIENDEIDRMAFERFTKNEKFDYDYIIVSTVNEAKSILEKENLDAVLMCYIPGDDAALDFLAKEKNTPFIIVIAAGDEEIAVQAMKIGAYDYLIKDIEGSYLQTMPITVQNVIKRRRAEEELRESEEKYRNLFENAQVGMYRAKLDGSALLAVNNKFAETFGYSAEEMLTKPTILKWADPKDREEMVKQLRKEGSLTDYVVPILTKKGEIRIVSASIKLYPKQRYIEGTVVDITEQRKTEEALKKTYDGLKMRVDGRKVELIKVNAELCSEIMERKCVEDALHKARSQLEEQVEERTAQLKAVNLELQREIARHKRAEQEISKLNENLEQRVIERTAKLEAVNKELKDFAYIVSHDLKAPVRAISQLCHWILQDYANAFDEEGREQMNLLISRTKRMDRLINGILQYSRIGRNFEKMEHIDINTLIRDVIENIAPPDNIQITIENQLPVFEADVIRMEQVFQNLLDNAIKFMDKSKGEIKIGCDDEGTHWKFYVADNGQGIEDKYHQKIFQIFQTLVPRDEHESTGIGLTIVKKIVDLYDGKIWLESIVGKGSTFYFTLPKIRGKE